LTGVLSQIASTTRFNRLSQAYYFLITAPGPGGRHSHRPRRQRPDDRSKPPNELKRHDATTMTTTAYDEYLEEKLG